MKNLKDKTVIVTGASSGIGWATALQFAREGAKVVLVARNEEKLISLHHQIEAMGGKSLVQVVDLLELEQISIMLQTTLKTFGPIDILVNNAGAGIFRKVEDSIGTTDYYDLMNLNFHIPVILTQLILPMMIKNGSGQIVMVSSLVGKRAMPFMSAYSASKFAISGFAQSLRAEVMKDNIDVMVIYPAVTRTGFYSKIDSERGDDMLQQMPGVMEADAVAKTLVKSCKKQKQEVVLSTYGKWFIRLSRWFPRLMDSIIGKQVGKRVSHDPKKRTPDSSLS